MRADWFIDGGMGIWMLFNMATWIIVFVGIVLLVVWAVRKTSGNGHKKVEETALDILKKRYAGGEITKEEYQEKKKDISS
jgi:putative membrane protein